jgi:hypothetical protein
LTEFPVRYLAAMRACHSSYPCAQEHFKIRWTGDEVRINGLRQMTGQVIGHVGRAILLVFMFHRLAGQRLEDVVVCSTAVWSGRER